jgi:hypothetical protein
LEAIMMLWWWQLVRWDDIPHDARHRDDGPPQAPPIRSRQNRVVSAIAIFEIAERIRVTLAGEKAARAAFSRPRLRRPILQPQPYPPPAAVPPQIPGKNYRATTVEERLGQPAAGAVPT